MDANERQQLLSSLKKTLNEPYLEWNSEFLWRIESITDAPTCLRAIATILPPDTTLYFEGIDIKFEAAAIYERHRAPETACIRQDTLSPRPTCFHIKYEKELLDELASLATTMPVENLFLHIKAYQPDRLLLWFHDAFDGSPLFLSGSLTEESVVRFAKDLGKKHIRETTPDPAKGIEQTKRFAAFLESQMTQPPANEKWWKRMLHFWK